MNGSPFLIELTSVSRPHLDTAPSDAAASGNRGSACDGGPYRFLRNPMYSVGQLQGYGYALLYGSLPGFFAPAAGHRLIYAFYIVAEHPFARSSYIMPRPAQTITSAPQ